MQIWSKTINERSKNLKNYNNWWWWNQDKIMSRIEFMQKYTTCKFVICQKYSNQHEPKNKKNIV